MPEDLQQLNCNFKQNVDMKKGEDLVSLLL